MSHFSNHILIFLAGLVCGGILTAITILAVDPNELEIPPSDRADTPAVRLSEEANVGQYYQRDPSDVLDTEAIASPKKAPAAITMSGQAIPEIPESYRETIGPAVEHISFGERFRDFEAEPIDESWAYAMEMGINDFVAAHGPESGEVFEFVQCRSSNCVLAGYTLHGQEPQGASVIGELGKQPWWQGGQEASSTFRGGEDRISFVIFIPRFTE